MLSRIRRERVGLLTWFQRIGKILIQLEIIHDRWKFVSTI